MKLNVSNEKRAAIRRLNKGSEARLPPEESTVRPLPGMTLPDVARFYRGRRVVGELYFTENPVRTEVLDDAAFGQMAAQIGSRYGLQRTA